MADDLFYSGIWRGMFQANEGHIFEYHNPAPRRPEVDESLRSDRRTLMSQAQKKDGKIVWCPVIKGNALLLPEAEEMEGPPVEYQNTLDLMKYFWARCPGARSIDRYAELVAPLYVDPSREANDENRALVGMVPGSDPTTAALRLATPAEASSAAARAALRYAPALRYSAPATVATETRIAPVAPVNIGMAPNASAALLPPVGTNIAPNVTAYNPGSLGPFPGPGVASNASAVQPPPVDSSWLDPTGLGPSLDLGIDLNAQSMSGVPFHPVNTDTTQDNIVFDWTNLSQYGDQDLVPVHPPTSVEMPSFENTRSAFNITGSSYPGYQSTFQGPAAIPTSGNTIPSLHAPVNALDDTATVPTPVAQFPITNAGTTSGFAGPYSHYVAPNSNPGMALNVTTMPTASFAPASFAPTSFAPVGDGRNLDVMNSTIGNYSVPWGSSMHTWLTSGRRSPGSVRMGLNHEDSSSNTIDPANYGVAHIPNQSGGNTFASNEQPTGNGQLINGVVFSNGAIADEYSDECTENHSDSTLPSDDLDDTTDEGTEEGADVEMVNGVRFR
ncbi:hypothetical protein F4801DRAFT_273340 [Xylaria longipes]|nr:hypothetical protein F4801DRAFT_273340 [Xylaria longipes]